VRQHRLFVLAAFLAATLLPSLCVARERWVDDTKFSGHSGYQVYDAVCRNKNNNIVSCSGSGVVKTSACVGRKRGEFVAVGAQGSWKWKKCS